MEIMNWTRDLHFLLKVSTNFWESFLLYGSWDKSDWDDMSDSSDEYKTNLKHQIKKNFLYAISLIIFIVATLQNFLNIDYKFDRI